VKKVSLYIDLIEFGYKLNTLFLHKYRHIMQSIFDPAIYLLNRLPFSFKFSLLSTVFFIPLLIFNAITITDTQNEITIRNQQIEGIVLLKLVRKAISSAELFRDMQVVTGYQEVAEARAKTVSAYKQLYKTLEEVKNQAPAELSDAVNETLQIAIKFEKQTKLNNQSQSQIFKTFSPLIFKMQQLEKNIMSSSQLVIDADSDRRPILDFLYQDLPKLSTVYGQGRAFGSYVLALNFIDSGTTDALNTVYDDLEAAYAKFEQGFPQIVPEQSPVIESTSLEVLSDIRSAQNLIDEQIISAMNFDLPWTDFEKRMSQILSNKEVFVGLLLDYVEQSLQASYADEKNKMMNILILSFINFILLAYFSIAFYRSIKKSINTILKASGQMADGNLTYQADIHSQDEMGDLTNRFNQTIRSMGELVGKVSETSGSVVSRSGELDQLSSRTSQSVKDQLKELDLLGASVESMIDNINHVESSANQSAEAVRDMNESAMSGQNKVAITVKNIKKFGEDINHAAQVIQQLSDNSENIKKVIGEIKSIADQTNLLALNASIEAARAGEHGRGFAVVADEVRSLSIRTQSSTNEIETIITEALSGVEQAVIAMDHSEEIAKITADDTLEVSEILNNMTNKTILINEMAIKITDAVKNQSLSAGSINNNIQSIRKSAIDTATNADGTSKSSHSLKEKADEMQSLMSTFQV
jgi:methyl-accepting chemotaxis protein